MANQPEKTELEVVKAAPIVPAMPSNPWSDAANEGGGRIGKILKFNRGVWLIGDNEVPQGTPYIAGVDQLAREWVKFEDGAPTDRHHYRIADGGFKDPWTLHWLLPLMPVGAFELLVFVTSSQGGDGAIRDLCQIYGRVNRGGMLPVVEIGVGSYKHKTRRTTIYVPELKIVSWSRGPEITAIAPAATPDAYGEGKQVDWDDKIPF